MPVDDHGEWRPRLPTDKELAKELSMSESSVRSHLNKMANWITGNEEFGPRERIFMWWRWREWERMSGATVDTPAKGTTPVSRVS